MPNLYEKLHDLHECLRSERYQAPPLASNGQQRGEDE
jgi:hypothetical protein